MSSIAMATNFTRVCFIQTIRHYQSLAAIRYALFQCKHLFILFSLMLALFFQSHVHLCCENGVRIKGGESSKRIVGSVLYQGQYNIVRLVGLLAGYLWCTRHVETQRTYSIFPFWKHWYGLRHSWDPFFGGQRVPAGIKFPWVLFRLSLQVMCISVRHQPPCALKRVLRDCCLGAVSGAMEYG